MALASTTTADDLIRTRGLGGNAADNNTRPLSSAVSWGAIAAGAAAAAALSLILLILGVGLGLSSVSPWAQDGVRASTFGVSTIVWLTVTQLLASAMGGYLAGRLRTRWTQVHRDEVYFRDTAHGFLAWAVASLGTAALLTSAIGSILGGGVQAGAAIAGGVASTASAAVGSAAASGATLESNPGGPMGYFVDSLFRRDGVSGSASGSAPNSASAAATDASTGTANDTANGTTPNATPHAANDAATGRDAAEVSRIFMNVSRSEPLPVEDVRYVGQLVAQRTGLSQQDAEKRVATVYARAQARVQSAEVAAREAADTARKASAYSALWLFVSLLIGAFVASLAATFGGQRRDA